MSFSTGAVLCSIALAALVGGYFYMKRPGGAWYAAELADTAIHGEYIGINPILASRGASLEESTVSFAIDSAGIDVDSAFGSDGSSPVFRTHYPASWVFHLQGWGIEHALSVRQHATSTLAQFILDFRAVSVDGMRIDAVMLLGEGMPATLGMFVRKQDGKDMQAMLAALHRQFFKPADPEATERSYLSPLDIAAATETMRTGTSAARRKVLETAGHNLWSGSEQEIAERLTLIELGLNDADQSVQAAALDTFSIGGRVPGGAALVAAYLERQGDDGGYMAGKGVEAAAYLLHEAHYFTREVDVIGTTDLREAHARTGGVLTPEQLKALERISTTPPHRRWTLQHKTLLGDAIAAALERGNVSPTGLRHGTEALRDYVATSNVDAPM